MISHTKLFSLALLFSLPVIGMDSDSKFSSSDLRKAKKNLKHLALPDTSLQKRLFSEKLEEENSKHDNSLYSQPEITPLALGEPLQTKDLATNPLLETVCTKDTFIEEQRILAELTEQTKKQQTKTAALLVDLNRRLGGKQSAIIGANLVIDDLEKKLNHEKEIKSELEKSLEEIKKAITDKTPVIQETPKKRGWWPFA